MSTYRISWRDEKGRQHRTRRWHVEFRDHLGRRQRVPGFKDQKASVELERKLVRLVALRASDATPDESMRRWIEGLAPDLRDRIAKIGLFTPQQVASLRPLTEVLDAWEEHMRARGTTTRYVGLVTGRARRVVDGTGAKTWTDLSADRVEQYLRTARERAKDPISCRTSNFYLQATRQFCRWAVRTGLATEDPLRVLEPLNPEADRRRERRALTVDEVRALLDCTEKGPVRDGVPGTERALLYRLAVETGLRRSELSNLVVDDLDLGDVERATVRVRAAYAKNRREATLPLRPETARALGAHVATKTPLARVFRLPKKWDSVKWLHADMADAGVVAVDAAGRVVDFHALRTTFGTSLARSGVALQVAQRLMRHSTPVLTSNVYTVLGRDDERRAIAALPSVAAPPSGDQTERATGTDGASQTSRETLWSEGGPGGTRRDAGGHSHRTAGGPGIAQVRGSQAILAEGPGFEPGDRCDPVGGFQNRSLRPLGHPSA